MIVTLNFFFSPPVNLCAVTYITEISLHVTLSNKSHFCSLIGLKVASSISLSVNIVLLTLMTRLYTFTEMKLLRSLFLVVCIRKYICVVVAKDKKIKGEMFRRSR